MKKKKFSINQAIVDNASECLNRLACLTGAKAMCKVKKHEEARVMYIQRRDHQNCPFAIPIGTDCICTCPVRVEIFRKYGV